MKKYITIIGIALALLVAFVVGIKAYHYWYDRKAPNFSGTTELYIYPWTDPEAVCDSIIASGNVRKAASLRRSFKGVKTFEVGHYTIDSTCTSMYAMRMVHKGWQTPVNLTLSSIRTPAVLARKVGVQMLVDSLRWQPSFPPLIPLASNPHSFSQGLSRTRTRYSGPHP